MDTFLRVAPHRATTATCAITGVTTIFTVFHFRPCCQDEAVCWFFGELSGLFGGLTLWCLWCAFEAGG